MLPVNKATIIGASVAGFGVGGAGAFTAQRKLTDSMHESQASSDRDIADKERAGLHESAEQARDDRAGTHTRNNWGGAGLIVGGGALAVGGLGYSLLTDIGNEGRKAGIGDRRAAAIALAGVGMIVGGAAGLIEHHVKN